MLISWFWWKLLSQMLRKTYSWADTFGVQGRLHTTGSGLVVLSSNIALITMDFHLNSFWNKASARTTVHSQSGWTHHPSLNFHLQKNPNQNLVRGWQTTAQCILCRQHVIRHCCQCWHLQCHKGHGVETEDLELPTKGIFWSQSCEENSF